MTKLKPTAADTKRMSVRQAKTLNITAKTLGEALAPAPPRSTAKAKPKGPLSSLKQILGGHPPPPEKKKKKRVWSVGPQFSASVLRPKPRPWTRKPDGGTESQPLQKERTSASPPRSKAASGKSAKELLKAKVKDRPKRKKKKSSYLHGQPRFEDGFRIVQGGLAGLGRRR